jgi:DNA-binding IclR family transcriptional regulator
MLDILTLFTSSKPAWTIDEAAAELNLTQTTAYGYFRSLARAGLVATSSTGRYTIGPAIIELDRLARRTDQLLAQGCELLDQLVSDSPTPVVALLCRLYRMKVMCVEQRASSDAGFAVGYERGLPMPLFAGAASKVILANIERRRLRRFYEVHGVDISAHGLGASWDDFLGSLRHIRSSPVYVTYGEVDPGRVGVSAPIILANGVIGSISLVASDVAFHKTLACRQELERRVSEAATTLNLRLSAV